MSPAARLVVGILIGFIYFKLDLSLDTSRPPALSADDVRSGLSMLPPLLQAQDQQKKEILQYLNDADRAWAMESSWGARVGPLLSPAERQLAEQLAWNAPSLPRTSSKSDPELLALAQILLEQGGNPQGALPPVTDADPWGTFEPRQKIRGVLALVQTQPLPAELCTSLLVATLTALDAQLRRIAAEEAAAGLLTAAQEQAIRDQKH